MLRIFEAMMNFVDFVQFGWLESCENFAFWFFDFVQSPPWQACNSKIRHFLVEGFLLLYETFRSLFFVSFKNFDFRNEIMLRTPGVCVCGASKLSLSIIDFFPYNICCWWIIYYQLKIFNRILFLLLLFLSIYFISHVDFPFLFPEPLSFFFVHLFFYVTISLFGCKETWGKLM